MNALLRHDRREKRNARGALCKSVLLPLCALCASLCALGVERPAFPDSPTFRHDSGRTGVFDDRPLPTKPKVLWVYKQAEQFVAAPVPNDKGGNQGALYITSIGPFNTAMFHALSLDPKAKERELWSKTSPYIKMPTVSSPAVVGDMLVFGDGMHQTDGATLYAYSAAKGIPLWQYEVPGKLVHMEGPPTLHKGRVFVGAGDAGVIAVDATRVTLDGKEQPLAELRPTLEARFDALRKAEEEVDESKLPRPKPKLLWQKGKNQWHVDAAVAITDDGKQLFVPSAYVDADKVGKRAMLCLNPETGETIWEKPLDFNPWGGATISGNLVLVACSSIRYDVNQLAGAKGQVIAFDRATGEIKWSKSIEGGGVLSPVVVRGDLCVYAGTDGKLICRDVATGARKWPAEERAGKPYFAAPAVSADAVYAVDLNGTLTAFNLADGNVLWKLDVLADKLVQAPGIVFASPAIAGGHIYIASNTLHGEGDGKPSVVVCIGDESEAKIRKDVKIDVDLAAKSVTIPCEIAPRKLPTLKDIYPLEVIATYPTPQGQKAHETVVVIDSSVKVSDIQKKLESVGAKAGKPATADTPATGSKLRISLILPGPTGKPRVVPIERAVVDVRTNKPLPSLAWRFTGSALRQLNPDNPEKIYAADLSGTFIAIYPVTDETMVQSNLTLEDSSTLRLELNRNIVPEEGTPAQLRIEVE